LRPERMASWGEVARNRTAEWDRPVEETGYHEEIAQFWDRLGKGESYEKINKDIGRKGWEKYQSQATKTDRRVEEKAKKER
jgi:hypothetical protein